MRVGEVWFIPVGGGGKEAFGDGAPEAAKHYFNYM